MYQIGEMQRLLSVKAERAPRHKFGNLYELLYDMEWLRVAHAHVKHNAGSVTAGCDGITMDIFDQHLESNLQELADMLHMKSFEPYPVRRVYIPKSEHAWRPLGIPSIRDRIVQEALRMVLEPIYEADFRQYSFGFRPNRCTMDAIQCIIWTTFERKKFFWIIEGDISSYFDTIKHRKLVKFLQKRLADEEMIHLIWNFLRAGVMEKKLFKDTTMGTPQGGIASPLLANVYLHELDRYMERYTQLPQREKARRRRHGLANFVYVRYADDFVVLCNGSRSQAEALKQELKQFLGDHLRIELSEEKTHVTHLNDGFQLLGFWIQRMQGQRGMTTKVLIPNEAIARVKGKINHTTAPASWVNSVNAEIRALNRIVGGWCRYYQYTSKANTVFKDIGHHLYWRMAHWLGRKFDVTIPEVMKRFQDGSSFKTDEVKLLEPYTFKSLRYAGRFLKPNPYTMQAGIEREDLPSDTYWTGYEARPGIGDLRPRILKRDKDTCQVCGRVLPKHQLQVDHIKPVRRFKRPVDANTIENLWTLCLQCHKEKTEAD